MLGAAGPRWARRCWAGAGFWKLRQHLPADFTLSSVVRLALAPEGRVVTGCSQVQGAEEAAVPAPHAHGPCAAPAAGQGGLRGLHPVSRQAHITPGNHAAGLPGTVPPSPGQPDLCALGRPALPIPACWDELLAGPHLPGPGSSPGTRGPGNASLQLHQPLHPTCSPQRYLGCRTCPPHPAPTHLQGLLPPRAVAAPLEPHESPTAVCASKRPWDGTCCRGTSQPQREG